jgi:transcription initiation factor IIE alpha subunit
MACPICKSTNTFKCAYQIGWKCNACGVHYYPNETEDEYKERVNKVRKVQEK